MAYTGAEAIARATHMARSMSSANGTISETSPNWWARTADMRSCAPSSITRRVSPSGSFWRRWTDSKPATIP